MSNPHKGRIGIDRLVHATGYSIQGLAQAFRHESAFRQELLLCVFMVPAAFWVGTTWSEISLLIGSLVLLLVVELLNSAVEATVDRISFELHDLSKRAKDYGSAAVLLTLLVTAGIWLSALYHRLQS